MSAPTTTALDTERMRHKLAASFAGVDNWIFDLDNTLYPAHTDLFAQVDKKITAFIADFLKVEWDEAYRVQKAYYREYVTSLRGLMVRDGVDPHAFIDFVHDIDHSPLEPDPALGAALAILPGRKFVLTNGSRKHAEDVTRALGIDAHFEAMFGIVEAQFTPKPATAPYDTFVRDHDIDPKRAVMFEDMPRNLEVPKQLGMRTVLVVSKGDQSHEWRSSWEDEGRDGTHVDHVTDDLADFLVTLCDHLGFALTDPA
ncbi:MAG: pyrimidine 5'-nucleotidase [Pseudomonadota bacterium]